MAAQMNDRPEISRPNAPASTRMRPQIVGGERPEEMTCRACKQKKARDLFTRSRNRPGGVMPVCKACTAERVRHIPRTSERQGWPERRAYDVARRGTAKVRARVAVWRALRSGSLVKPDRCARCGEHLTANRIQGHHADYARPLDVEWLCQSCHALRHRELAAAAS